MVVHTHLENSVALDRGSGILKKLLNITWMAFPFLTKHLYGCLQIIYVYLRETDQVRGVDSKSQRTKVNMFQGAEK